MSDVNSTEADYEMDYESTEDVVGDDRSATVSSIVDTPRRRRFTVRHARKTYFET